MSIRNLLFTSAALLVLSGATAFADENLFPPEYAHANGMSAYDSLRDAKFKWLRDMRESKEKSRDNLKSGYKPGEKFNKADQERSDKLDGEIKQLDKEIDLLQDPTPPGKVKAQRALVKKNVEAWISALRVAAATDRENAQKARKAAEEANNKQDAKKDRDEAKEDDAKANAADAERGEIEHDFDQSKLK